MKNWKYQTTGRPSLFALNGAAENRQVWTRRGTYLQVGRWHLNWSSWSGIWGRGPGIFKPAEAVSCISGHVTWARSVQLSSELSSRGRCRTPCQIEPKGLFAGWPAISTVKTTIADRGLLRPVAAARRGGGTRDCRWNRPSTASAGLRPRSFRFCCPLLGGGSLGRQSRQCASNPFRFDHPLGSSFFSGTTGCQPLSRTWRLLLEHLKALSLHHSILVRTGKKKQSFV